MPPRKQFCLRGHDTFVVGRNSGRCRSCKAAYAAKRYELGLMWTQKNLIGKRIADRKYQIRKRRKVKKQQMYDLLQELKELNA